jgi:hypothetical protein
MLSFRSLQQVVAGVFAATAFLSAADSATILAQDVTGNPECRAQCNTMRDNAVAACDDAPFMCLADGSGDSRCYAIHSRCVARAEEQRRQCRANCRGTIASAAIGCTSTGETADSAVLRKPAVPVTLASLSLQGVSDCSTCKPQLDQDINACVETFGLCTDENAFCETAACVTRAQRRFDRCMRKCSPQLFQPETRSLEEIKQ